MAQPRPETRAPLRVRALSLAAGACCEDPSARDASRSGRGLRASRRRSGTRRRACAKERSPPRAARAECAGERRREAPGSSFRDSRPAPRRRRAMARAYAPSPPLELHRCWRSSLRTGRNGNSSGAPSLTSLRSQRQTTAPAARIRGDPSGMRRRRYSRRRGRSSSADRYAAARTAHAPRRAAGARGSARRSRTRAGAAPERCVGASGGRREPPRMRRGSGSGRECARRQAPRRMRCPQRRTSATGMTPSSLPSSSPESFLLRAACRGPRVGAKVAGKSLMRCACGDERPLSA